MRWFGCRPHRATGGRMWAEYSAQLSATQPATCSHAVPFSEVHVVPNWTQIHNIAVGSSPGAFTSGVPNLGCRHPLGCVRRKYSGRETRSRWIKKYDLNFDQLLYTMGVSAINYRIDGGYRARTRLETPALRRDQCSRKRLQQVKNVKSHVFLEFERKTYINVNSRPTYSFTGHFITLNHSGFSTQLPKLGSGESSTSNQTSRSDIVSK